MKKEIAKEEFAANEIKAFCEHVMHPDSDLHKYAEAWIKERLQANGVNASDIGLLPTDIDTEFPVDNNWAIEDRTHAIGKRQGAKWMRGNLEVRKR